MELGEINLRDPVCITLMCLLPFQLLHEADYAECRCTSFGGKWNIEYVV